MVLSWKFWFSLSCTTSTSGILVGQYHLGSGKCPIFLNRWASRFQVTSLSRYHPQCGTWQVMRLQAWVPCTASLWPEAVSHTVLFEASPLPLSVHHHGWGRSGGGFMVCWFAFLLVMVLVHCYHPAVPFLHLPSSAAIGAGYSGWKVASAPLALQCAMWELQFNSFPAIMSAGTAVGPALRLGPVSVLHPCLSCSFWYAHLDAWISQMCLCVEQGLLYWIIIVKLVVSSRGGTKGPSHSIVMPM